MKIFSGAVIKNIALTALATANQASLPTKPSDLTRISLDKSDWQGDTTHAPVIPLPRPSPPQELAKTSRPCSIMMTGASHGELFTHGTAREFFDYATRKHNISAIDIDAGRDRIAIGPVVLQSDANVSTIAIYGSDTKRYVVSNCTGASPQVAAFAFVGPAADAMADFLKARPDGESRWFSSESTNRRVECHDSVCLVQSWDWPDRCHDSINLACLPEDERAAPNTYLLASETKVFSAGRYALTNYGVADAAPLMLPSNSTYTASPGCYVACYTYSGVGVHPVSRGIWIAGQVRVPGDYEQGICRPHESSHDKQLCAEFEACTLSPCWVGGDTGGWFNLSPDQGDSV